ncbi:S8 family serine peptidase, partial [Halovivax sp.]|uniref:S8 family serine peptidase n=1 Tax=Halovivax sp. TaxID=1935978 RepID=UPI0025BC8556
MSEKHSHDFDRRTVLKATAAAGTLVGLGGVTAGTPGRDPGPKEDEVLVGVTQHADDMEAEVAPYVPENGEIVHKNETIRYVAVKFPDRADPAKEAFKENVLEARHVQYAEDNRTYRALGYTPNDPLYDDQYAPQITNCEEAWETTLGDSSVTISVIDQGIQYDHPNLEENMDGSVEHYGYDFVEDESDPYPVTEDEDHGTHVGGIAAGGTDNGEGHAGISNCSMLSARALDESGGGSLSDISDAITWSADQGAEVINMSLGGGGYDETMANACEYAYEEGSLLVAAAGNDGPCTDCVSYPAAYDEVMAVSATDENDDLAGFSSTGPEIELAAPGDDVLSTVNWDDYAQYSGTSMASPVVAGVAALTISQWDTDNETTRAHLKNTAEDIGLADSEQGSGRVDADGAVNTSPDDD